MIHLTYFRCLCEDKITHALEVSISTSLAAENSLHCKHLILHAMNLPECKEKLSWAIPCYYLLLLVTNATSL